MVDPSMFRSRLLAREHLIGTFVKTSTIHATEYPRRARLRLRRDRRRARAVRPHRDRRGAARRQGRRHGGAGARAGRDGILSVLDCGATGVLVPHVATAARAREVAVCRYQGGRRGYSGSPRHAGYGATGMWKTIEAADAAATVIAQ